MIRDILLIFLVLMIFLLLIVIVMSFFPEQEGNLSTKGRVQKKKDPKEGHCPKRWGRLDPKNIFLEGMN